MANTSAVYARIDNDLKNKAEDILSRLGISPTSAVQMLYSQIILHNGMPFELKIPVEVPISLGSMNKQQLDYELLKGFNSLKSERIYTADEIDAEFDEEID